MASSRLLFLALVALACAAAASAQECKLTDGTVGKCLPVTSCVAPYRSVPHAGCAKVGQAQCCVPASSPAKARAPRAVPRGAASKAVAATKSAISDAAAGPTPDQVGLPPAAAPVSGSGAEGAGAGKAAASGKKILVVGDSQSVGTFGKTLLKELTGAGATVEIQAACGKAPTHFLSGGSTNCGIRINDRATTGPTPAIGKMLSVDSMKPKPDLVIIELGGNGVRGAKELVQAVQQKAGTSPCLWVGPVLAAANAKSDKNTRIDSYYAKLTQDTPPCTLLDSRQIVKPPEGSPDGLHYNGAAAPLGEQWARDIAAKAYELLAAAAAPAAADPAAVPAPVPAAAPVAPVVPVAPAADSLAPRFAEAKRAFRFNKFA